jgi:hypothetical protein
MVRCTQPQDQNTFQKAQSSKIWTIQYPIIKQVSPITYRLKLPPSLKIHNVFHVDLLTPYYETEEHGVNYHRPPPELIDGEEEFEVEEIINKRTNR